MNQPGQPTFQHLQPEGEIQYPKHVKVTFHDSDDALFRWLNTRATKSGVEKHEILKTLALKAQSGQSDSIDSPASINVLKNKLQDTISRHNRETQNLKNQITQLTQEKIRLQEQLRQTGLGGLGDLAGTIEAKVNERIEKYEQARLIEDLRKQIADKDSLLKVNEKEIAELEAENEQLADLTEKLEKELGDLDGMEKRIEKFGPTVLGTLGRVYPNLQPALEGFVQKQLGNGLGDAPLSEDDRQGLEFARDLRHKFSGEEQESIVELLTYFYQDKNLLKYTTNVTKNLIQQQQPAQEGAGSGND